MSRVDDLARGLALRSGRSGTEVDDVAASAADLKLERIARAAAAPITRRRALRVAGGALIAAAAPTTFLTPQRAMAAGCAGLWGPLHRRDASET